jgi:hypothetical protein
VVTLAIEVRRSAPLNVRHIRIRDLSKSQRIRHQALIPIEGVGDSPRGPLKQRGNPHLKPATKPKHSLPNHAGYGPCRRDPDGPPRRTS